MSDPLTIEKERWQLTGRLRQALLRRESPRLEMAAFVSLAGGVGFLASFGLLHAGLDRIPERYVVAASIAYGAFLALLYLWIRRRREKRFSSGDERSLPEVDALGVFDAGGSMTPEASHLFSAGGGHFGGGGASGTWGEDGGGGGSGGNGLDLGGDDTGVLVALAVAALILFGASLWIVLSAPSLLAELALDGVLSAGLYRRLTREPRRPWIQTALRRTLLPFSSRSRRSSWRVC